VHSATDGTLTLSDGGNGRPVVLEVHRRPVWMLPSDGRQGSGVLGANPDTVEFDASVLGSQPERQPRCTVAFRDALGRVFVLGDLLQRDLRLEFNDASPTPGLERSP
jgi:hypothetical protein